MQAPAFHLRWGIKKSLIDYVTALRDGTRKLSDSADESTTGEFQFSLADISRFDLASHTGVVQFRGRVEFGGHMGMLYVCISDPWLHMSAGSVELTVADGDFGDRLSLIVQHDGVEVSRNSTYQQLVIRQPKLTESGTAVFGEVYETNDVFDEMRVTLPLPETR
ncbi:HtaA domain-containing protein [Microbacterium aerolatum]|nr:HtaA domain-containing protein [Microbacterium aerolatum]